MLVLILNRNFFQKNFSFFAKSQNHQSYFSNLLDFPTNHCTNLNYDKTSISKRPELPPPNRPQAKQLPQPQSFDTKSNISIQKLPSSFNVSIKTIAFGGQHQNFDPSSPRTLNQPITNQPSISVSPHQFNTPPSPTPPSTGRSALLRNWRCV